MTPIGTGKDAFWTAAMAGTSGVGPPTLAAHPDLPVQVVGEVDGFDAQQWMPRKLVVRTDRNTHFAFAACTEALADAALDLDQEDKTRIGMVLAADYGGLGYVLDNLVRLHQRGPSFVSAYMAIAWLPVGSGRAALDPPRHDGLLEDRRQRRVRRDVRARRRVPRGPARRLGRGHRRRLRDPARRGARSPRCRPGS